MSNVDGRTGYSNCDSFRQMYKFMSAFYVARPPLICLSVSGNDGGVSCLPRHNHTIDMRLMIGWEDFKNINMEMCHKSDPRLRESQSSFLFHAHLILVLHSSQTQIEGNKIDVCIV